MILIHESYPNIQITNLRIRKFGFSWIRIKFVDSDYLGLDEVEQSRNSKQNANDDGGCKESLLEAATGVECRAEVIAAAEGAANLSARALKKNGGNQKDGQDQLDVRKEGLHESVL